MKQLIIFFTLAFSVLADPPTEIREQARIKNQQERLRQQFSTIGVTISDSEKRIIQTFTDALARARVNIVSDLLKDPDMRAVIKQKIQEIE